MTGLATMSFSDLAGWRAHDHQAAFAAFCHSACLLLDKPPTTRPGSARSEDLLQCAKAALDWGANDPRAFFEQHFVPLRLSGPGLLTGYYEPEFEGRLVPDAAFRYPLHKRPADLVPLSSEQALAAGFTDETSFARKGSGGLAFHASRGEVMDGALDGLGLELVWLKDPLEAYIIHIQGSARICLDAGKTLRIAFDGKSGHPYQSLGKALIKEGHFTAETISMDGLITFLRQEGEAGLEWLRYNPSYIFFKQVSGAADPATGPIAAAGVPLLPMRSIAVDRHRHTFGLPFWIETSLPTDDGLEPFRQLAFAHDTGSAIKGAARADLFVGTGKAAGSLAGTLQQEAHFTCLMPKAGLDRA